MIRLAEMQDIPAILAIFDQAREFMRTMGNPSQWPASYPNHQLVEEDIRAGHCYVFEEAGQVVGTFAFIIGPDPTYQEIEGAWHFSEPYGTIHRIASNGQVKGLAYQCFDFCLQQIPYLRIDTIRCRQPFAATVLASVARFICQMAALALPTIIINKKICSRADFFAL